VAAYPLLAGLAATCRSEKGAEDHDEERMGIGRPDKAAFPFLHGNALGHNVRIFLLGEAGEAVR
jgi:hypothetical protein